VDVRFLAVLGLLLLLRKVVAMGQWVVVVLVGMPVPAMLPLVQWVTRMMVRDVVVIVDVRTRGVGVLGLATLTLGVLRSS
jgi:hypothetical protein